MCLWSQGALGWPCPMAGLSYCCCWLSRHHGSLYYLCRSLSSLSLCGASPRHRGHRAYCQWEAVSPAVTDCHSHSNSFTNIHHSFHTATMHLTGRGHMLGKYLWSLNAYSNMPTYPNPLTVSFLVSVSNLRERNSYIDTEGIQQCENAPVGGSR